VLLKKNCKMEKRISYRIMFLQLTRVVAVQCKWCAHSWKEELLRRNTHVHLTFVDTSYTHLTRRRRRVVGEGNQTPLFEIAVLPGSEKVTNASIFKTTTTTIDEQINEATTNCLLSIAAMLIVRGVHYSGFRGKS
jgi:hypothetical protein